MNVLYYVKFVCVFFIVDLSLLSNLGEFVLNLYVWTYDTLLKPKTNSWYYGILKSKCTPINLAIYFNLFPIVACQRQVDALCVDFSSVFGLLPQFMFIRKMADSDVSWYCSHVTNRQSLLCISSIFSSYFVNISVVHHGHFLGPSYSIVSLMVSVCNFIKYVYTSPII